jgi:hypothetical protein
VRAWQRPAAVVAACAAGVWLPAEGTAAPNPIQAENARPGTASWQRPEAVAPAIEGYASETSASPGDTLHFHVSTRPAGRYRVEIYRLGWYGGTGARLLACIPSCTTDEKGAPQAQGSPQASGVVSVRWPVTDTLKIPSDWTSGYLAVHFTLATGRAATTYVILKEAPSHHSRILVQVPVNTWQAYNGWGGMSLYEFEYAHGRRANHVSFDRPYAWQLPGAQNPLVWEYPVVRFLERMGYDVSYQTDADTHRDPRSLMQHRLVIVNGHDEYWTKEMFDAFDGARNRGTNLAFMGANAAYWQIRYEDGERTIVSYKNFNDPIGDPSLKTVRFRDLTPPRYECTLLGIQHQGGSLQWGSGDYAVQADALQDPWLAGTGFALGGTVPVSSVPRWTRFPATRRPLRRARIRSRSSSTESSEATRRAMLMPSATPIPPGLASSRAARISSPGHWTGFGRVRAATSPPTCACRISWPTRSPT